MIVPEKPARNDYVGDATITQFPFNFAIIDETHLTVLVDGVALVLNSNYTVSGVAVETGGTVTITPPPAIGVAITLLRNQPFSQTSIYQNNEDFPQKRLEKDLNKVVMALQQVKELSRRSLAFAKKSLLTDPILPDGVAGQLLQWKSATEIQNVLTSVFVPGAVTLPLSIANGGTAAGTPVAARTSLGTAGTTDENIFTKVQHWQKGADIASAATLAPGTDGNYFHVTGVVTITAIASQVAGTLLILKFDGALTVTHNATTLILRGAINMVTAPGDILVLVSEGTGNWREIARSQVPTATTLLGHLGGLGLSNNAIDPTNGIDFSVGEATSDDPLITNRVLLNAGAMTKKVNAVWAAGTAVGGLAAADNLTGAKTFNVWIFRRSNGIDDYFFSTSLNPVIPDTGTKKRRIGLIRWDGATIVGFAQFGDEFMLKTPVIEVANAVPAITAATLLLTGVPTGTVVKALLHIELSPASTTQNGVYLSALADTDIAPTLDTTAPLATIIAGSTTALGTLHIGVPAEVWTDASGQIRSRSIAASGNWSLATLGWRDLRGRG